MDHAVPRSREPGGAEPPHGGRLRAAVRAFSGAPRPWIDLSTGINPYAWPMPPVPDTAWTRLPEPEALAELEAAASAAYGAGPAWHVVAAPGTSILIATLARLLPGRAAIVGPTYGEYAASWPEAVVVPDVPAAVRAGEIRIVCQPDNPTGMLHDMDALLRTGPHTGLHGGTTLVDESYADFVSGASVVPRTEARPGLVVLRSFGKAYGLAGLRLGFALVDGGMAKLLRRSLGPWPVSGPAILAGTAALADAAWRETMANRLGADRARFDVLLRRAGFVVLGGTPLFSLARCGDAPGWADRLGRRGILVRAFDDRPGCLRFGLPGADPAAWARLEDALA